MSEAHPPDETPAAEPTRRWPVAFVGHGSPMLALDPTKGAPLSAWGRALGAPRAILVISAHWEDSPARLGATHAAPLVYDFGGFPEALSRVTYAAPGAPALAASVRSALGGDVVATERGLDHGAWTPLVHLYPDATVPVLQLSMPRALNLAGLFALGRALAPLRDEGVLVLGSGNVTHNLGRIAWDERGARTEAWAREFDVYVAEACARRDFDALIDAPRRGPAFALAHPRDEHYRPLVVAAGAASTHEGPVRFPVDAWEHGNLSRRAVKFG